MDSATEDGVFVYPYVSTIPDKAAITLLRKLGMFPVLERKSIKVTEFTGV